jgi:ribonuclease HI
MQIDPSRPQVASESWGTLPEYLLVCEARSTNLDDGRWHFALETACGTPVLEAGDDEPGDLNRLTLLAAVRGLEAIEGPAKVTLVSNNRYLIRSLTDSLPRWRGNDFVWENFGRRTEIQNADLWRRIDRALAIHSVEVCLMTSRLVSCGVFSALETNLEGQGLAWRIDAAQDCGRPKLAKPIDSACRDHSDRLRWWLLSGGASSHAAPRQRFTNHAFIDAH